MTKQIASAEPSSPLRHKKSEEVLAVLFCIVSAIDEVNAGMHWVIASARRNRVGPQDQAVAERLTMHD